MNLLSLQGDDSLKTEHSEVTADVSCDGSFSDTEDEAGTEEEEQSLSLAHSDWLPPEPVSKMQFIATPTYVDDDCFIYLHDTEKSKLRVVCNRYAMKIHRDMPCLILNISFGQAIFLHCEFLCLFVEF